MKKGYCVNCGQESTYKIESKVIEEYKNKKVNVKENVAICEKCGEEIYISEIENENLKVLYNAYREVAGIITPDNIIEFREKYNISQRELVDILGWGKMTINRYERGSLPSKSHQDLLKLLVNDEEIFKKKVDEAYKENRISLRTYKKLKEQFEDDNEKIIRSLIIKKLSTNEDIYNGFRSFDLERVENLISYIADKVELYKTSLNKYLWFMDFINFRENIRSITGIRYVKAAYGPVIDNKGYELLINLLDDKFYKEEEETDYNSCLTRIISKKNYNMSLFSAKELEIIDNVINKFKTKTCYMISKLSHKEEGWKNTDYNEVISYDYAEKIKLMI